MLFEVVDAEPAPPAVPVAPLPPAPLVAEATAVPVEPAPHVRVATSSPSRREVASGQADAIELSLLECAEMNERATDW